jgi:Fe2+ transport system protein FeoA
MLGCASDLAFQPSRPVSIGAHVNVHTSVGIPLVDLPVDAEAELRVSTLDDHTRALLRALGLTDGSSLRVCKSGEPFIIQVRATRIGMSRSVAAGLLVQPLYGLKGGA